MISSPPGKEMRRPISALKPPEEQMHDIGPSGKGEVATQGDESEDAEILETRQERRPISEPPANKPATGEVIVDTGVRTGVTPCFPLKVIVKNLQKKN